MLEIEVIEETGDFIVVNKSAGLISEKNPYENTTAEDQVYNHLLKTTPKPYIGVIHRLDRVTSGVLIFAKKKSVLVKFNKLFSDRKIRKTYLAVVRNKPPKNKDTIVNFLLKNKLEKKADIAPVESKEAKESILSYEVIGKNEHGYLLEIQPKTGRFHQIRAQLAHIGSPIIGDSKYGSEVTYLPLSVCLHASKLSYKIPSVKGFKTFEAPLPDDDFWRFDS